MRTVLVCAVKWWSVICMYCRYGELCKTRRAFRHDIRLFILSRILWSTAGINRERLCASSSSFKTKHQCVTVGLCLPITGLCLPVSYLSEMVSFSLLRYWYRPMFTLPVGDSDVPVLLTLELLAAVTDQPIQSVSFAAVVHTEASVSSAAQLGHCCSSFLCCCSKTLELSFSELSNCSIC